MRLRTLRSSLFALALAPLAFLVSCSAGNFERGDRSSVAPKTALWELTGDADYRSPHDSPITDENLENQSTGLAADWYRDQAFYHVWVKSFADSDGDGSGDLDGVTQKLSYIRDDVGCDAVWLSPVFDCAYKGTAASANMHGYDTVDYYSINPLFGDEDDLSELLAAAHEMGMKVIFDFVPNHTSSSHPWFRDSYRNAGGKGDWYLWQNSPLAWSPMGSSSTWYSNASRGQYYYAPFWSGMPDLNFRNREVREEMKNVARYWLNRGFDGMRIDAVRYLVENPGSWADTADTHAWFRELKAEVVDSYAALGHPKFMVGEAWINGNRSLLESYFGAGGNEFSMLFDFDFAFEVNWAINFAGTSLAEAMYAKPEYADSGVIASFLSNHDNLSSRPATLYADPSALRLATALSLLRPTVPFVYYGNEVGQTDAPGYGGQDIRLRYPFDWNRAAAQKTDPSSLLAFHRALLGLRRGYPALRSGFVTPLRAAGGAALPEGIMAYALSAPEGTLVCVFGLMPFRQYGPFEFDLSTLEGVSLCFPLFGDPSGAVLSGAASPEATLTLAELGPYAARVYLMDLPSAAPTADLMDLECRAAAMYLRGSMNDWGISLPMTRSNDAGDDVWEVSLELTAGAAYTFKFDASGFASQWPAGQNWGSAPGNNVLDPSGSIPLPLVATGGNVSFTPTEGGTRVFRFNFTQKKVSVE